MAVARHVSLALALAAVHAAAVRVGRPPCVAPRSIRMAQGGTRVRCSMSAAPAAGEGAEELPMLGTLLEAARAEQLSVVEEEFERIPHGTMKRVHELAADGDAEARWLVRAMEDVMQARLEAGATKLRELLQAGEINKMDAQLVKLVREGGADTAFNIVLTSNIEHARAAEDERMLQLYTHLHTRMQEELEKTVSPARGLLHRVMRTDDASVRERILVDFLAPKSSVRLPSGDEVALDTPAPPKVSADELGDAVADAVAALGSVELGADGEGSGAMIAASVEDIRQVAIMARAVIAEHGSADDLERFSAMLMPTFAPWQQQRPPAA